MNITIFTRTSRPEVPNIVNDIKARGELVCPRCSQDMRQLHCTDLLNAIIAEGGNHTEKCPICSRYPTTITLKLRWYHHPRNSDRYQDLGIQSVPHYNFMELELCPICAGHIIENQPKLVGWSEWEIIDGLALWG